MKQCNSSKTHYSSFLLQKKWFSFLSVVLVETQLFSFKSNVHLYLIVRKALFSILHFCVHVLNMCWFLYNWKALYIRCFISTRYFSKSEAFTYKIMEMIVALGCSLETIFGSFLLYVLYGAPCAGKWTNKRCHSIRFEAMSCR